MIAIFGTLALLFFCGCAAAPIQMTPPAKKIILLSIDDFRADRLAVYGSTSGLTPALDRFAAGATVFQDAMTQATWTMPSHASMLSSLLPSSHHGGGRPGYVRGLSPQARLVSQWLKPAGYKSAGFVSGWPLDPRFGYAASFDEYQYNAWTIQHQEETTLDSAAEWAERHVSEKYFLFVHTFLVHRYVNILNGIRDETEPCPPPLNLGLASVPEEAPLTDPGGPGCASRRKHYDWAVRCMNQAVGSFLERLSRVAGDDSLVIVTADHGEMLCDMHGGDAYTGHAMLPFDQEIHVPLLVRFPNGLGAGRRIAAPATSIDIAPTIAEAAGVAPPEEAVGVSLAHFLSRPPPASRPRFAEGDDWASVRTDRHKLISLAGGKELIFDLRADPGENVDIAGKNPSLDASLRTLLDRRPKVVFSTPGPEPPDDKLKAALKAEGYLPR